MKLSLRQLQLFCAVSEHGSTTAAAHAVALSQSATSAALNELERLLGTRLFDRLGKRLVLNDQGRALLPKAQRLLEAAQHIETGFAHPVAGLPTRLRIGASSTIGHYVLPRLLSQWRQALPQLRVDVSIGNTARIAAQLGAFELDMGLLEGPCHEPEMTTEPWLVDELVIIAGARHPLAREAQVSLGQLCGAEWLLREPGSGTREEVEHLLLRHLHGLGISCLPRRVVADHLASGQLCILNTGLPALQRRFYLVRHRDKFMTPALARVWEMAARER